MAPTSFIGSISWLVQPENERDLRLLRAISQGAASRPEMGSASGIVHPEVLSRSVRYLEESGLVRQFLDGRQRPPIRTYESTPLGRRAIDLVERAKLVLVGGAPNPKAIFTFWVKPAPAAPTSIDVSTKAQTMGAAVIVRASSKPATSHSVVLVA